MTADYLINKMQKKYTALVKVLGKLSDKDYYNKSPSIHNNILR